MFSKDHILSEIRRTANENGGQPLGWRKFMAETGIRYTEWCGKHWARWSDAIKEAGLSPNQLSTAYDDAELFERYISVARRLGSLPTSADLRMETKRDPTFPHEKPFARLGSKADLIAKVLEHIRTKSGYEDIIRMCEAYQPRNPKSESEATTPEEIGFVYMLKSGKFYKIGRTNALGRRERELAIQLPQKADTVHTIKTDDPVGIEAYWHRRFESKRKNGEWFELAAADVAAFKRRKFM